jgi:hypothetical protein
MKAHENAALVGILESHSSMLSKKTVLKHITSSQDSLASWFIPADSARATIILLHGIGGCKEQLIEFAQFLHSHQFNIVLTDFRSQGSSNGFACTYGYYEKEDIQRLIDLVKEESPAPIGVHGSSLGGAIAYQVMALDNRVAFGIVESTFDNLQSVVREYTSRFIGFQFNALADFATWRAGNYACFDPSSIDIAAIATTIKQPVLVVHGTADIHIPIELGKRVFDLIGSEQKKWIAIEGATHNNMSNVGGAWLLDQKLRFINDYGR